jgi:hypothetical protein
MLKLNDILTNDVMTDKEKVEKYAEMLHQSGSITDEEYEKIKAKLDDQEFVKSMLENAEEMKSYLMNIKEFVENTEKVKNSTSKKVLDLLKSGTFGEEFKNMIEELENTSVEEFEELGKESKGKLGQLSRINLFSNILSNLHLTLGLKNISDKDVEEAYIDDKGNLYIKYKEGDETKYIKVSMEKIDESYQQRILMGMENVTTSTYVVKESNEKEYKQNKDNRSKVYDNYKEATKNFTASLIEKLYDVVEKDNKLSALEEHLNYFLFDNIELKKPLTEDVIWYFKNIFNYKDVSESLLKIIIDAEYEKPLKYYKSLLLINLYNNLVNENLLRSTVKYSINSRKELLRKMLNKATIRIGDENISILRLLSRPQDLFNKITATYLKNKEEVIGDIDIIEKMLLVVLNDLKVVKDKNENIEKNIEIIEDYIRNIQVVKKLLKDVDTINYEEKIQMLSDFFEKVINLATYINRIIGDNTLKSAIESLNEKLTNINKAINSTKGLLRLLEENSKVVEKKDKLIERIGKRDSKNNTSFKELSISILQSLLMAISSLTDVSDKDALERFKEEYKKSLRENIKSQLKDLGIQDDLILQNTVDSFIRQLEEEGKIDEKIEELVVSFTSMLKDSKNKKAIKRFQNAFENIFASSLSSYYLKFIGGTDNSLKRQSLLKIIEKYIIPAALLLSKEISKGVIEVLLSKEYKAIRGSFISENNNNVKVLSESDILNVKKKLEETLDEAFKVNSMAHRVMLFMSKVLSQLGRWVLSDEVVKYANMSDKAFIDKIYELVSQDGDNTKQIEDIKKLIGMFLSETFNINTVDDLNAFIELLSLGGVSIEFNGVTISPRRSGTAFTIKQSEVKTLYELIETIKEYSSYIYEDLYLFNNAEEYFKIPKELNSNNVLDYLNYKNTQLLAIYMLQLYRKTGEYNNLYERNKTLEEMYAAEFNKRYREAYKQVILESKRQIKPKKEEDDKEVDKDVLHKIKEKAIELSGLPAKKIKDAFNLIYIYDRYFKGKLSFDRFYRLFLGFWNRFSSKKDEKVVAKNIIKVNDKGESKVVVGNVVETKDKREQPKGKVKDKKDTVDAQEKESKLQKINEKFKGKKIRFISFKNAIAEVFDTLNTIENVHLIIDENENTESIMMKSIIGSDKNILVVRKDETKIAIENNKTFKSSDNIDIDDLNVDYDVVVIVGRDLSEEEIRKVEEIVNSGKTVYLDKSLGLTFKDKTNVVLYEDVADLLGAMISFNDLRLESITAKLDEKKNVLLRALVLQELKNISEKLKREKQVKGFDIILANYYVNLMTYLKLKDNELFDLFKYHIGNKVVIESILNRKDINVEDLYSILNEMYDTIKDKIKGKNSIYEVIKENKDHINKKLDELKSKRKKEEAKQTEKVEQPSVKEKQKPEVTLESYIERRLKEVENEIDKNLSRLNDVNLTDKEKNEILNSLNYLHKQKERLLSKKTVGGKTIRQELEEKLKKLYDIIQVEYIDDLDSYIKKLLDAADKEDIDPFILFQIDNKLANDIVSFVINKINDKEFEGNRYFAELREKSKGNVDVIKEELYKDLSIVYENIVKPIVKELYGELTGTEKEEVRKKLSAIDKSEMLKILTRKYSEKLIDKMSEKEKDELLKYLIEKYDIKLSEKEKEEFEKDKGKVLNKLVKKNKKVDLSERMSEQEKSNFFNEFFEKNVEEEYFYSYVKPIQGKERTATQALFWWFINGGVRYQEIDGKIEVEDYDKYKEGVKVLNEKGIDPKRYTKPEEFISGKLIVEQRLKKVLELDYVKVVDEKEIDGKIYTVIQLDYDHSSIQDVEIKKRFEGFTDDQLRKAYAYREFMDIAVGKSFKNWCTCYIGKDGDITESTVRNFLKYNNLILEEDGSNRLQYEKKHTVAHVFVDGKLKYGFSDEDTSLNLEDNIERIIIDVKKTEQDRISNDKYVIESGFPGEIQTYYGFDYENKKLIKKENIELDTFNILEKKAKRVLYDRMLKIDKDITSIVGKVNEYGYETVRITDKKTNKVLHLKELNSDKGIIVFKDTNGVEKILVVKNKEKRFNLAKSIYDEKFDFYVANIDEKRQIRLLYYFSEHEDRTYYTGFPQKYNFINLNDLLSVADLLFNGDPFYIDENNHYIFYNTEDVGLNNVIRSKKHIVDNVYIHEGLHTIGEEFKHLILSFDFENRELRKYVLNSKWLNINYKLEGKKQEYGGRDVYSLLNYYSDKGNILELDVSWEYFVGIYQHKDPEIIKKIVEDLKDELSFALSDEHENIVKRPYISYDEKEKTYVINSKEVLDYVKNIIKERYDEYEKKYGKKMPFFSLLKFQKKEGKIIGAAHLEAAKVLIDRAYANDDTLPHEFAHFYIRWFYDTPIVQEAIKQFGSEEALVQAIGEQAVKQQGEAWVWWKKFAKAILEFIRSLINANKIDKETLLSVLTDMFLQRVDLETGEEITTERMKELQQKMVEKMKELKSEETETTDVEKQEQKIESAEIDDLSLSGKSVNIDDYEDISQEEDDVDFC